MFTIFISLIYWHCNLFGMLISIINVTDSWEILLIWSQRVLNLWAFLLVEVSWISSWCHCKLWFGGLQFTFVRFLILESFIWHFHSILMYQLTISLTTKNKNEQCIGIGSLSRIPLDGYATKNPRSSSHGRDHM